MNAVLSCAIMAHPARRPAAERVLAALAELAPRIVYDPDPGGPPATLRTATAAWSAVRAGATHHLVVQDDVTPAPGFARQLLRAVADHPAEALCAFTEWGCQTATMVRWAALAGFGLAECVDNYVPTQATVLPVADAAAFARYAGRAAPDLPDDIALRRFLAAQGRSAYALVPNLVDHDALPSLIGNAADGRRRATCLPAGGNGDPGGAGGFGDPGDPSGPAGTGILFAPPRIPTQTWSKGRSICFGYRSVSLDHEDPVPTRRLLLRQGRDLRPLTARLDAELAAAEGIVDLELHIGYALLHELWLTAVALGCLLPAGPTGDPPAVPAVPPGPALARQALRTMGPGALRCFVDATVLGECEPALTHLVVEGVDLGLALRTGG